MEKTHEPVAVLDGQRAVEPHLRAHLCCRCGIDGDAAQRETHADGVARCKVNQREGEHGNAEEYGNKLCAAAHESG